MSSYVWTVDDLRNLLLSNALSLRAAPTRNTPHDAVRRQGHMDALIEIAVALGITDANLLAPRNLPKRFES